MIENFYTINYIDKQTGHFLSRLTIDTCVTESFTNLFNENQIK